jgi:Pentapeptide repeats (8 copies)
MGTRLRSWWQSIKQHQVSSALIALFVTLVVLVILGGYKFNWDWTGFNRPSKTLWDWLQLLSALAIPVVVGFGAVWFTLRQGKVANAENTDNQRESALQAYIDKMSELLLEKNLRDSTEEDEVRKIARVRTLTVLRRLDAERRGNVLQFLYESGLISKAKQIINLDRAWLYGANLYRANLYKADLSGARLSGVNLYEADLRETNLSRAHLRNSTLRGADLSGANLKDATNIPPEQLEKAKSLQGATMPDGSIHR